MDKKTVLITGCSQGGIGEALAREFQSRGYYVFATLRNTAKAGSLAALPNVEVLSLEVTSTPSIQAAAAAVAKRTGGTLDVLVNNAGADFVFPLLDVDVDKAKQLFDVNVWSILATTQAFSPLLIKAKGAIFNVTSTAACMPLVFRGIYSSSKVAAQRLSETLRHELAPLGVRVLTGLIGAVETPIHANAGVLNLPDNSYYACIEETVRAERAGETKPGSIAPQKLAKNIVHDIEAGRSGLIYRGGYASLMRWIGAVSDALLEYVVNFEMEKKLDVVKKTHQ